MNPDAARTHWRGHSAFCIEAGEAKILIDSFDNSSRDKGWSSYFTVENSTQKCDR